MSDQILVLAGRQVPEVVDRIRRYCGLSWSGGAPETWAFRYYDAIPSIDPDRVDPLDVVVTGALHPNLSRPDLTYFAEEGASLESWLTKIPTDVGLGEAGDDLVEALAELAVWDVPAGLSILTKVLHRKRPRLIPLFDRAVVDWYRPVTGERAAATAWRPLLRALRSDLSRADNQAVLDNIADELRPALGESLPTRLRMADVAIWMGSRAK